MKDKKELMEILAKFSKFQISFLAINPLILLFIEYIIPKLKDEYITEIKIDLTELIKINSYLLVANLILLAILFSIVKFTNFISSITDFTALFSLTLSFILVYATLSLLSFTYALLLDNDQQKKDLYRFLNKETTGKKVTKSGESFLISTMLVIVGFVMIYLAILIKKFFFAEITVQIDLPNLYTLITIYFAISLFLIFSSIFYFSIGFIHLTKAMKEKLI